MASMIDFVLSERHSPGISFPLGSALVLSGYWRPGPVRLFSRAEVPEIAFLGTNHRTIPDFVPISAKLAVCPEARELIEALEPGHQFFAVEIKRLDGRALDTPYYLLIPSVRLNAVWVEKSEVKVTRFTNMPPLVHALPGRKDRVVLRRAVIDGHHLWSGQDQLGGSTFFSDTLTQAVRDRKWKGLEFTPLREE